MTPIPGMSWDDVTPGKHPFTIVDAEMATSAQGNPMIVARLLVDDGDHEVPFTTNFSLLPQAQFKLRSFLRVLGFDKNNDPDLDDLIDLGAVGLFAEQNGRVSLVDWMRDLSSGVDDDDEETEDEAEAEEAPAPKAKAKASTAGKKARDF